MFLEHNHMAGIYYIPVHYRQYQVRDQVSVVYYKEMVFLRCVHPVNALYQKNHVLSDVYIYFIHSMRLFAYKYRLIDRIRKNILCIYFKLQIRFVLVAFVKYNEFRY